MLSFYNTKILYNIELGTVHNGYWVTELPFCKREEVSEVFPNAKVFDSIHYTKLADTNNNQRPNIILLTPEEYRAFVVDWINHSVTNKLYNWDANSFFMEYFNTIKTAAKVGELHGYYGKWLEDDGAFDTYATDRVINMDVPAAGAVSPIIIDNMCEPELSLKIEDVLYALKHGDDSLYTAEVNALVRRNVSKLGFSKELYSSMMGTDLIKLDIDLDLEITIDKIDYDNPQAIYYFYYYSFLPGIRTNLVHLQRTLEAFRK